MTDNQSSDYFDYVIVGGGTAGSLLANRLTSGNKFTVCLLEAGPPDTHPYINMPAGFIKILSNPAYTWRYESQPVPGVGGRKIPATQGMTLGGSSAINGMIYNRGQHADYDRWEGFGNRGWGFSDVLPYFKRTESRIGGEDAFRGRNGELFVSDTDWRHPICEAFLASAMDIGVPHNLDYNGSSQAGVGYMQRMIHRGRRWSAARAFLRPVENKKSLDIRTRAYVTSVIFEGTKATGIRYRHGGRQGNAGVVFARREVILAAGAINTPRLLQVSGVGPPGLLSELGVPVVKALDGVGENFRDHYCARLVVAVKNILTINEKSKGSRLAVEVARWLFGLPSILSLSPSVLHLFWKSNEQLAIPDLQGVFSPASYKEGLVGVLADYPGMTLGFYQQRPKSVGYVRARSADPFDEPLIQPNYLAEEEDRRALIGGLRLGRRILSGPELGGYNNGEKLPGIGLQSDDELLDYARRFGSTVYHFAGTCRMGSSSDRAAVVDDQLRVHGMQNLRVVDASIMPDLTSGNTCAPVLMIAEKAADMILGCSPHPR